MPKTPAYVCKNRHGTYYFRLVLPINSGKHPAKRREIRSSLRTDSLKLAIRRARKLRVIVDECLERIAGMADELKVKYITEVTILPDGSERRVTIDSGDPDKDLEQYLKIRTNSGVNNIAEGLLLTQVIQDYLCEKKDIAENREKTVNTYREALYLFVDIVGDRPITQISHDDFRTYSRIINQLPANRTKKAAYKGKPIEKLITLEIPQEDRMSSGTVININSRISTFWKWCSDKGVVTVDFSSAISNPKKRSAKERRPFTNDELMALFSGYIYRGDKPRGASKWTPSKFWLPLLGLYTGARLEELAQLHIEDITLIDNTYCISINETGQKTVKNRNSVRNVPIHSKLVEFGFLDFVENMNKNNAKRLFPELKKTNNTGFGSMAGKTFHTYRLSCGVDSSDVDFHSFRKTFISNLANNSVPQEYRMAIVGHSDGSVHNDVYTKYSVTTLKEQIEKLNYQQDMSHVDYQWYRDSRL